MFVSTDNEITGLRDRILELEANLLMNKRPKLKALALTHEAELSRQIYFKENLSIVIQHISNEVKYLASKNERLKNLVHLHNPAHSSIISMSKSNNNINI